VPFILLFLFSIVPGVVLFSPYPFFCKISPSRRKKLPDKKKRFDAENKKLPAENKWFDDERKKLDAERKIFDAENK